MLAAVLSVRWKQSKSSQNKRVKGGCCGDARREPARFDCDSMRRSAHELHEALQQSRVGHVLEVARLARVGVAREVPVAKVKYHALHFIKSFDNSSLSLVAYYSATARNITHG